MVMFERLANRLLRTQRLQRPPLRCSLPHDAFGYKNAAVCSEKGRIVKISAESTVRWKIDYPVVTTE